MLQIWRRSYATPPPSVEITDERWPGKDPKYQVKYYSIVFSFFSSFFSTLALCLKMGQRFMCGHYWCIPEYVYAKFYFEFAIINRGFPSKICVCV